MTQTWTPENMPDLKGKVVAVTGSNKGIGLHTIKHLATHGAKVYCGARSKEKFDMAQEKLLAENPSFPVDRLVFLKLDLGSIHSVLDAIKEITAKEKSLHILINSAGIVTGRPAKEGEWDEVMRVDHIGHFILTNGLFPLLKAACVAKDSDVRVISVSSNTPGLFLPKNYKLDWTAPTSFAKPVPYYPWSWRYLSSQMFAMDMVNYSIAKLANSLFIKGLQQRVDEQNIPILCLSLHPGGVATEGADQILKPIFRPLLHIVQITPEQGSYNSLWAATAKEPRERSEKFKGNYLEPIGAVTALHPIIDDEEQCQGLWDATTAEVNRYLESCGMEHLLEWK